LLKKKKIPSTHFSQEILNGIFILLNFISFYPISFKTEPPNYPQYI
jgi:hypothetical protein